MDWEIRGHREPAVRRSICRHRSVRRGVSQSVRELEWKQAEMARTIINGMLNNQAWDAMTMLDWDEGHTSEVAPGESAHPPT